MKIIWSRVSWKPWFSNYLSNKSILDDLPPEGHVWNAFIQEWVKLPTNVSAE